MNDCYVCVSFNPKNICELGRQVPEDCGGGCAAYEPDPHRKRCEVWRRVVERYSRVMGYHRPVESWNAGKQAEYQARKYFKEPGHDPST